MFANTQMMGMDLAFPDVCLTPTPVPVPIPYPNFQFGPVTVPAAYECLMMCAPAHNMFSVGVMSLGDCPGVALGVASGMVMGPRRHITAAFTCLVGGAPVTRLTSMTMQNSTNMVGMRIVPSQFQVLVVSP